MNETERKQKLKEIFDNDHLNLLSTNETGKHNGLPKDARLIDSFREISEFFESYQRKPEFSDDIVEYRLASRLEAIKKDPCKVKVLLPYDYYNLLKQDETKSFSVEDVISDDPYGLLGEKEEIDSIFTMSHVKPSERIRPDYIARRRICTNFDDFKEMFDTMHSELSNGIRHLIPFKSEDLKEGHFYVLRGVLFFVAVDNSRLTEKEYSGELYRRKDGRTRCIFDNGTESTMLFRSLMKAMQHDGFSISESTTSYSNYIITESDRQCGYIYVLRSLSRDPQIRQMKNLYKIGYSLGDVTTRIKNATREPTYLMSDVEVVLTARCYNLDVLYLESAVHKFFGLVNVNFKVRDDKGNFHSPKEWFQAPLKVIEEAIQIIVDKRVNEYKYDPVVQMIIQINS